MNGLEEASVGEGSEGSKEKRMNTLCSKEHKLHYGLCYLLTSGSSKENSKENSLYLKKIHSHTIRAGL